MRRNLQSIVLPLMALIRLLNIQKRNKCHAIIVDHIKKKSHATHLHRFHPWPFTNFEFIVLFQDAFLIKRTSICTKSKLLIQLKAN
jgi:hypothetical protein